MRAVRFTTMKGLIESPVDCRPTNHFTLPETFKCPVDLNWQFTRGKPL